MTVGGVLVFLTAQTARLLFGIVIAAIWVTRLSELQPFPSKQENYFNDFFNLCSIIIILGALSLHIDLSDPSGLSLDATNALLWLCMLSPYLSGVVIVVYNVYDRADEDGALSLSAKRLSVRGQRFIRIVSRARVGDESATVSETSDELVPPESTEISPDDSIGKSEELAAPEQTDITEISPAVSSSVDV